ncbi:hypothetical protein [Kitasatospora sp. LaBMicrA B282]|uniref:hypothetical protein n=1 Tax=Kitasatospora sp. LaBMicrA B282 TaxID=3420949 RepID=UPI003D0D0850
MFVAGPGGPPPGRGPQLSLHRVLAREFATDSATARDPDLRVFVSDLVRPYGLPVDEAALAAGRGHCYAEMAEQLLPALVAAEEAVDLLILVFASPDVQPGRAAAVHLSRHCPGGPLAFALCDQGAAGVFSALRIAREFTRAGECGRALVLVAEQSQLHYRPAGPAPWPSRHTVVGLLCTAGEHGGLAAPTVHPAVAPARSGELLAAELRQRADPGTVLLLGPGLAGAVGPGRAVGTAVTDGYAGVVRARDGSPYTGLWSALAAGLPRWRAAGRGLLLADYDAGLGYLGLVEWPGREAPARRGTTQAPETARSFVRVLPC